MLFSRSTDCGVHWSTPVTLSPGGVTDQRATVSIDPTTGSVFVAWRRVADLTHFDGIHVVKSTDGGKTFGPPIQVRSFVPFDQKSSKISFRTVAYPTMAIDGAGRLYIAWSSQGSSRAAAP